jgi:lipopolysaccharide biosynthesis regulator YciM
MALQLLKVALAGSPVLLQDELPRLLEMAGARQNMVLTELVAQGRARGLGALKRLVFAAIAAGVSCTEPLQAAIEDVFSQDPALQAVWQAGPAQYARVAREIGAFLAQAEKYRCNECGFSGRSFYWQCPACHEWDSFEAFTIVKLR